MSLTGGSRELPRTRIHLVATIFKAERSAAFVVASADVRGSRCLLHAQPCHPLGFKSARSNHHGRKAAPGRGANPLGERATLFEDEDDDDYEDDYERACPEQA